MGNSIRRIESPASTALQVIEAHRLFHLVTVMVHGKAMLCRSSMPSYVILCLLCHNTPTICHIIPTNLLCPLLCLLCHSKPTVCHTMPTRVPCYAYNVMLSCSTYCGTPCLLILYLFFHNKPRVCHNLPTKESCYPYYNILSCSAYCGIPCNNKPTIPTVP